MPGRLAYASHILCLSKITASEYWKKICNSKDSEATFAKLASECNYPSYENNGYLGCISESNTLPEFREVVWKQELNTCSKPVETNSGYHLIWVHNRQN